MEQNVYRQFTREFKLEAVRLIKRRSPDRDALSFEERVGLLVNREAAERDTKRLKTRLKFAGPVPKRMR